MSSTATSHAIPRISLHTSGVEAYFKQAIDEQGVLVLEDAYDQAGLAALRHALIDVEAMASPEKSWCVYQGPTLWAMWNLFDISPTLMRLTLVPEAFGLIASYFGQPAEFTRATVMRKVPGGNQSMGWHQDNAVPVDKHLGDEAAFSVFNGVPHRSMPMEMQPLLLNARTNVEEQFADSGCLMVVPGSHRKVVPREQWAAEGARQVGVACPVPAGSILFYQPLVLHASGSNTRAADPDNHRRVITTEFRGASCVPDKGLKWYPWKQTARIERGGVFFRTAEKS